jgi:hypothetical protein
VECDCYRGVRIVFLRWLGQGVTCTYLLCFASDTNTQTRKDPSFKISFHYFKLIKLSVT